VAWRTAWKRGLRGNVACRVAWKCGVYECVETWRVWRVVYAHTTAVGDWYERAANSTSSGRAPKTNPRPSKAKPKRCWL
jgi:hypothetical protein